jgi:hypothetical protein
MTAKTHAIAARDKSVLPGLQVPFRQPGDHSIASLRQFFYLKKHAIALLLSPLAQPRCRII